jgi:hypothetical protein
VDKGLFGESKKTCVGNITLAAPWEQSTAVERGGKSVKKRKNFVFALSRNIL